MGISDHPAVWPVTDLVIFDCDSTLSRVEGIDELARLTGTQDDVAALTKRAMDGEVPLETVYDHRLNVSNPTQAQVGHLRRIYRENVIADAREVIAALQDLGCVESQRETSRLVAEQVLDALRGDDYRNVVNLPFGPGAEYRTYRPYLELAEKLGRLQGQLAGGRIHLVEIEIQGEALRRLVRPVAVAVLKGMLRRADGRPINYVNAPVTAHAQGIQTRQIVGMELVDYPHRILCRVYWEGGSQTVAGVLFAGGEARLVQYDDYHIDARLEGYLLFLYNRDIPGVIGRVGALLGEHNVNIGEWRMGRDRPGGRAVSLISLDSTCPRVVLDGLRRTPGVHAARLVKL